MLAEAVLCLAMNIYFEARGENTLGQMAVAEVTMNRVAHEDYPNDVCSVVWQKKQFSWTHDGKSDKMTSKEAKEKALKIARTYVEVGMNTNLTDGATHFHASYVKPWWAKHFTKTTKIGKHIFYK